MSVTITIATVVIVSWLLAVLRVNVNLDILDDSVKSSWITAPATRVVPEELVLLHGTVLCVHVTRTGEAPTVSINRTLVWISPATMMVCVLSTMTTPLNVNAKSSSWVRSQVNFWRASLTFRNTLWDRRKLFESRLCKRRMHPTIAGTTYLQLQYWLWRRRMWCKIEQKVTFKICLLSRNA